MAKRYGVDCWVDDCPRTDAHGPLFWNKDYFGPVCVNHRETEG